MASGICGFTDFKGVILDCQTLREEVDHAGLTGAWGSPHRQANPPRSIERINSEPHSKRPQVVSQQTRRRDSIRNVIFSF
jgi:hypothetical protein